MAPPNVYTYEKVANSDQSSSMSLSSDSVTVAEYNDLKARFQQEQSEKLQLLANLSTSYSSVGVDDTIKAQIRRYVKYTIFHDIKFIKSNEEFEDLSNKHTFGRRVLSHLSNTNTKTANPRDLWNVYKKIAKTALNIRRSDVQYGIQEQVLFMFQKTDWEKGKLDKETADKKGWLKNKGSMVTKGKCYISYFFWFKQKCKLLTLLFFLKA